MQLRGSQGELHNPLIQRTAEQRAAPEGVSSPTETADGQGGLPVLFQGTEDNRAAGRWASGASDRISWAVGERNIVSVEMDRRNPDARQSPLRPANWSIQYWPSDRQNQANEEEKSKKIRAVSMGQAGPETFVQHRPFAAPLPTTPISARPPARFLREKACILPGACYPEPIAA